MESEKGSTLIQVITAAGILSIVALAISNLISSQLVAVAYIEDQFEKNLLGKNIESLLLSNADSCKKTLNGIKIDNNEKYIMELKESSGTVIFKSNSKFGRLAIGQIKLTNDTVPGPSSSGFVDVEVPLSRTRTGGGPSELRPILFKINVSVDSSSEIESCFGASGAPSIKNYSCSAALSHTCSVTSEPNTKFCALSNYKAGGNSSPVPYSCTVSGPTATGNWTLNGNTAYYQTTPVNCNMICMK